MKQPQFVPLKTRRLSSAVENAVKEQISAGIITVGDKLPTEREIAKQFEVSLVTVREALGALQAQGIVEKKRGRWGGIVVTGIRGDPVKSVLYDALSARNLSAKDLSEARRIIEPAAARIAAARIDDKLLASLDDNISYCRRKIQKTGPVFSPEDFFDIEERNVEFHRLVAEATDNPVVALTVDCLMDFTLSFKKRTLVPDLRFSTRIVADHKEIRDALKGHDGEAAYTRMASHIAWVEDYLTDHETLESPRDRVPVAVSRGDAVTR